MRRLARLAPQPPSAVPLGTGGGSAWVGSPVFLTKAFHVSVEFSLVGGLGEPPLLVAKAGTLAGSSRSRMDRWTPPGLGARFESTAGSLHIFRQGKDRWGSRPGSRTTTGGSADELTMMWTCHTASHPRRAAGWRRCGSTSLSSSTGSRSGSLNCSAGGAPVARGQGPRSSSRFGRALDGRGGRLLFAGPGGEHVRLLLGHHAEAAQA